MMADYRQGDVYRCNLGVQRGNELAGSRPALVVSHDEHNRSGSTVLVMPTTRGDISPGYAGCYPPLEQIDTRISYRNLKTVKKDSLGRFKCTATQGELRAAIQSGIIPYLSDYITHLVTPTSSTTGLGDIRLGPIPNHVGWQEKQHFLIIARNRTNDFAIVAKVDDSPVGQSSVRVPLNTIRGPANLAAHCHQIQPVDLAHSLPGASSDSYIGTADPASLVQVIRNIISIIRPMSSS